MGLGWGGPEAREVSHIRLCSRSVGSRSRFVLGRLQFSGGFRVDSFSGCRGCQKSVVFVKMNLTLNRKIGVFARMAPYMGRGGRGGMVPIPKYVVAARSRAYEPLAFPRLCR